MVLNTHKFTLDNMETVKLSIWDFDCTEYIHDVHLSDSTYLNFIKEAHEVFKPLKQKGIILKADKRSTQNHINTCIENKDLTYLQPALVTRHLNGKKWQDLAAEDGFFMLNNKPWVTDEQWWGFMPFMIEALLRSNEWLDYKFEFFIFSLEHLKLENTPLSILNKMSEFLDVLVTKYTPLSEDFLYYYGEEITVLQERIKKLT